MIKNIIYLRVSKEDSKDKSLSEKDRIRQDLEMQLPVILKTFNLKESDCIIYREKGSAYDQKKAFKRDEFKKVLIDCFGELIKIEDLFFTEGNINKSSDDIRVYFWDLGSESRAFRDTEKSILLFILGRFFNVKLFSCNQPDLNVSNSDDLVKKSTKYMMILFNSYAGESYSDGVSKATRKAVRETTNGVTISYKGNKWGRKIKNSSGKSLSLEGLDNIRKDVLRLIDSYEKRNVSCYYDDVIKFIYDKYSVSLSKSTINRMKKYNIDEKT